MHPAETFVGSYFTGNMQLIIPRYQRQYQWDANRWIDLWRDIASSYRQFEGHAKAGTTATVAHFMGALILETVGHLPAGAAQQLQVVDGQQRLLTFMVLQAAIRDHDAYLNKKKLAVDNDLAVIKPKYGSPRSVSRFEVEKSYKPIYEAIASGKFLNDIPEKFMKEPLALAYQFYRYQLWRGRLAIDDYDPPPPPKARRSNGSPPPGSYLPWGDPWTVEPVDLSLLESVLNGGLKFLEIQLDPSDEEASVVFETMNSRNTPLRQFDHLRNSIFVCMPTHRDSFHASTWSHVEKLLGSISYSSLRSTPEEQFFYEYMISLGEERVTFKDLHRAFMERVYVSLGYPPKDEKRFDAEYAKPFGESALLYPLALGQVASVDVFGTKVSISTADQRLLSEILAMSGGPPVPIVLRFLREYLAGTISVAELSAAFMDLQSFLVRMMLAGDRLSPLRSMMMQISLDMGASTTVKSLRAALKKYGWRTNKDVLASVQNVALYSYGGKEMFPILRGIEAELSGGGAHPLPYGTDPNEYSVEHVFPQTPKTPPAWLKDLGAWGKAAVPDAMRSKTHCLGNLAAVTNYDNSRNGKKPFDAKKAIIASVAPLKVNEGVLSQSRWTTRQIDKRTIDLAEVALKHWPIK